MRDLVEPLERVRATLIALDIPFMGTGAELQHLVRAGDLPELFRLVVTVAAAENARRLVLQASDLRILAPEDDRALVLGDCRADQQ